MCDCILVLLALVFPPLPVWIKCGICSAESLIGIALSILGYIPGVIYALYVIAKYPIRYVVLDEESQVYRHPHSAHHRIQQGPPRVIIRERVSTPSTEQILSNSNNQYYGSTNNENPPDYEEVLQQQSENQLHQHYQPQQQPQSQQQEGSASRSKK